MKKILQLVYQKVARLLYGRGIGKYKSINKVNRYFVSQLRPDFIEYDGMKLFLDEKDSLGLSIAKIHEKTETQIVREEIREGDVVLDIGAHIGYYTLIFAKLVGEKGRVYSFEPSPENFRLLTKNVEANNFQNVVCVNKIVSNKPGKVKLFGSDSSTGNRLFGDSEQSTIEIDSITLDEYFKNGAEEIGFVKLDIQGAEPLALEGMSSIINKNKKLTIMQEWWPNGIKRLGRSPDAHLKELAKSGFEIIEIDDINGKLIPTSVETLMKKYPNKDLEDINLLCKRVIGKNDS